MFFQKQPIQSFHTKWEAPSNIALVKYWGKYGAQLPKNPSISFTLSYCKTTTEVIFSPSDNKVDPTFEFYFNKKERPDFHAKINQFFEYILPYLPGLKNYHLKISSSNSFPHSSGIASSASAMAALALCVVDFEKQFHEELTEKDFLKKASFLPEWVLVVQQGVLKGHYQYGEKVPLFMIAQIYMLFLLSLVFTQFLKNTVILF